MGTIRAEWIFSIIKSLEARLQYAIDESLSEEEPVIKEALEYFKDIQVPLSN